MKAISCYLLVVTHLLLNSWCSPGGKGRVTGNNFMWSIELKSFSLETVGFLWSIWLFLSLFLWFPSQIQVKFTSKLLAELIPTLQSHTMVSSLSKHKKTRKLEVDERHQLQTVEMLWANTCWGISIGFQSQQPPGCSRLSLLLASLTIQLDEMFCLLVLLLVNQFSFLYLVYDGISARLR